MPVVPPIQAVFSGYLNFKVVYVRGKLKYICNSSFREGELIVLYSVDKYLVNSLSQFFQGEYLSQKFA